MLIYNVTAHLEPSVEQKWLKWMKQEHIPEMLGTKKFTETKIFKIITDQDTDGISYAVQYYCDNRKQYESYLKEDAPSLGQKAKDKFGEKILFFRTELQLIYEYT